MQKRKSSEKNACALVFEGGGMRASFSAAYSETLLKAGLTFPFVAGISAGSSLALNHVSKDWKRSIRQFVKTSGDARFGGVSHFLRGHGYFNSDFLYEGCVESGVVPFDWLTFCNNPSEVAISSFGAISGKTYVWHKADMPDALALMKLCRASSTMPILMNPITLFGEPLYDGGIGTYLGLSYKMALDAGFERFVLIATQPKGYRKKPFSPALSRLLRMRYQAYPHLLDALFSMPARYNRAAEKLEHLEKSGQALVIRPEFMNVHSTTLAHKKLALTYQFARAQADRDIERICAFL